MTATKHPTAKLLLNATEAASFIGVSSRQFHRINKSDPFPFVFLGRGKMYAVKALEKYIEDRQQVEAGS